MKKPATAVLPLLLSVEREKKMKKHARAAPPLLPGVRGVILCTLLHAGIVVVSFAFSFAFSVGYTLIITSIFQSPPSWLLPRLVQGTDGEVDDTGTIVAGLLVGAVSREAARTVALMLPRRHRRVHFLHAYVVLVAVTVLAGYVAEFEYSMWSCLRCMFVAADPCCCCCCCTCFSTGLTTVLVVIFILGVIVLGLILRRGEDED